MERNLRAHQKTIGRSFTLEGFGVHSGKAATVRFSPADADSGILFRRSDVKASPWLRAHVAEIGATDLCTALGPTEFRINTIEHLMAAVAALGLDNLKIEVDGPEIPILDGTSAQFLQGLDAAGVVEQPAQKRFIKIRKPVRVEGKNAWAEFTPHETMRFEIGIEFDSPLIGQQKYAQDLDEERFRKEISTARTFGFMKDVESLWAAGLALGSSLENSIVIADDHSVINPAGLRFKDEFVRHKMLDAIGDTALAGMPFIGCFRSWRGGHRLNSEAVKALLSDESNFELV